MFQPYIGMFVTNIFIDGLATKRILLGQHSIAIKLRNSTATTIYQPNFYHFIFRSHTPVITTDWETMHKVSSYFLFLSVLLAEFHLGLAALAGPRPAPAQLLSADQNIITTIFKSVLQL